jgi:formiminotetrahydrofolate cyclodeaminase
MGRLRADRYPYDPHDGVLAVRDFGQARDCYQAAGEMEHAARAQAAAMMLRAKIETDYAAARMNLMRAVDSEHWTTALAEARRLLRLTHHLGAHDYAEFLQRIAGRASARASVEP